MANQDVHSTYVERDRVVTNEGTGAGAFIIGGIVVALLVLIWLFSMGAGDDAVTTVPATENNSVTIEAPAAPATITPDAGTGSNTTAPAPEATAPADTTESTTMPAVPAAPSGN